MGQDWVYLFSCKTTRRASTHLSAPALHRDGNILDPDCSNRPHNYHRDEHSRDVASHCKHNAHGTIPINSHYQYLCITDPVVQFPTLIPNPSVPWWCSIWSDWTWNPNLVSYAAATGSERGTKYGTIELLLITCMSMPACVTAYMRRAWTPTPWAPLSFLASVTELLWAA